MPFLNLILYGNQLTHLHACNQLLVLCRHILWRLHMQIQSHIVLDLETALFIEIKEKNFLLLDYQDN